MHMRYAHLRRSDRLELSILRKKGYSIRSIAAAMERNPSSVSRELRNNAVRGRYDPARANHKAYVKRKYSKYQGMKVREHPELEAYIAEKMPCGWSPDRIAGRWRRNHPSAITITAKGIYKYLASPYGAHLAQYLKYGRRKPRKVPDQRGIIPNRAFIDERPKIVNERRRFGDFEGDTMGRPRSASPETLVVVRERQSRCLLAVKVPRLGYAIEGFRALLDSVPASSLTLDNGVENARHEELGVTVYFCHPFSAWEKGSVEQGIGLIREHIPKRADLRAYSQERIDAIVERINTVPMKCLGYRTPKEVFEEQSLTRYPECCT